MGNFIQALGNGLPVRFGALVKRIIRDATGVTVVTTRGTYRAKTAVVTVSTGVLRAGAIEFVPGLPATTRDAIAALPLGLIYKCALGFNVDLFPQFKGAFTVATLQRSVRKRRIHHSLLGSIYGKQRRSARRPIAANAMPFKSTEKSASAFGACVTSEASTSFTIRSYRSVT